MASIYHPETGQSLCEGLQGCGNCDEAIRAAERIADQLGADVHLIDDDGEWLVHPAIDGKREPADCMSAEQE